MITLDDEQVRQVMMAAGPRWSQVRAAMGINPAQPQAGTAEDNPPPQVEVPEEPKPKKRRRFKKNED